jgi:thiol-disulfide isomerase/thioredoxin
MTNKTNMLSKPLKNKDDCGCGGGKYNCVSKNSFAKILKQELQKLDCGCGCKGWKALQKKYNLKKGGAILGDCPAGWRNDGLTCVAPCNPDEFDDGLTCRKKCPPGQIDDGLTCRVPIVTRVDDCPGGWISDPLTCRKPIVTHLDDCPPGWRNDGLTCFKDLSCRQEGDPWKPVWDSGHQRTICEGPEARSRNPRTEGGEVISRNPYTYGGEVFTQAIRGKEIRGRVNFDELMKEATKGIADLFEGRIDLAAAFDPERNGVAAAFRKFGDDIKKVMEEVGNRIKEGFEKMGAETRRAFEEFARNAERDFKQFGEDFVNKMKDPDFWVEAVGIMAYIAAAAVSVLVTVGTLGAGSPIAVGLMAAASMAGPATKMIVSASRGEPIDALDIAQLVISGASALVPGMSATVGTMVKTGLQAASYTIQAVQIGQGLGMIPSTCIQNCPTFPPPPEPPVEEMPPSSVPPPEGQKTDEEILNLQPTNTIKRLLYDPDKRRNPEFMSPDTWIKKYRDENYGPGTSENIPEEDPSGALVSKEDVRVEVAADTTKFEEDVNITDFKIPGPNDDLDFGRPICKLKEVVEPINIITPEEMEAKKLQLDEELDFGGPSEKLELDEELDFGGPSEPLELGEELDFGGPSEPLELDEELDFGGPLELDFGGPFGDLGDLEGLGKPSKKKSLTLYYAEWCGYCKKLMPEWKKLGSAYKNIKIKAIEEKKNKSFPVNSYPTIIFRNGNKMEKYEGLRTKSALINFLKKKL